jgi:hypothetical protein
MPYRVKEFAMLSTNTGSRDCAPAFNTGVPWAALRADPAARRLT